MHDDRRRSTPCLHLSPSKLHRSLPSPPTRLQVCDQAPETIYGSIVADKVNSDTDLAQAVGQIVYTAQAIMENAADKVGGWLDALTKIKGGEAETSVLCCRPQRSSLGMHAGHPGPSFTPGNPLPLRSILLVACQTSPRPTPSC